MNLHQYQQSVLVKTVSQTPAKRQAFTESFLKCSISTLHLDTALVGKYLRMFCLTQNRFGLGFFFFFWFTKNSDLIFSQAKTTCFSKLPVNQKVMCSRCSVCERDLEDHFAAIFNGFHEVDSRNFP